MRVCYLNETPRLADLILPPLSALSRPRFTQHFTTYMINSYVRYGAPVLPCPAEGYDDWEIMLEIAPRVGKADRTAGRY